MTLMRHFYIDTNVFISQMKPDDIYHREAGVIGKSLERGEIRASTSVLTLLETASVVSRLYTAKRGNKETHGECKALVIKALGRLVATRVNFIHMAGDQPMTFGSGHIGMPSLFSEAIILSLQTTLRTLDLIHIAAARYAKRIQGGVGAFVTGDREFLSKKKELSSIVEMPILSPKEYVEGLGLRVQS
jgi:predicted nucleic acid-binding protein